MDHTLKKLLGVLAVILFFWLAQSDASWFPQQYRHDFYMTKMVIGGVAVIVTVYHIWETWDRVGSTARQWRYYALLLTILAITSGSRSQMKDNLPVQGRNITALFIVIVALIAAILSIREDRT